MPVVKKRPLVYINRYTHWVALISGLLFSYLAYQVSLELGNRNLQLKQQGITSLAIDALEKELEVSQGIVYSIRSFFVASTHVSRHDFFLFTESELKARPSIQALEWIPYVIDEQREEYRNKAIQDGFLDFEIRELNPQGEMIRVRHRTEYFPVYFVEPLKGNEAVLGYDLASSEERLSSLQQARLTGKTQVTASISLVQANEQQNGFLILQPIFIPANNNSGQQKAILNGFAVGVFRIENLFESAIGPVKQLLNPLKIELLDVTDAQNIQLLYARASIDEDKPSSYSSARITQDIHFANRTWRLSSFTTAEFVRQHSDLTHWIVLSVGIVLTLLITSYLRTIINREFQIKKLVEQRSQALQTSEKVSRAIVESAVDAVITINEDGIVDQFNPAAVRMFGYIPEEVIGQNVKMLMPDPYKSEHDDYLMQHQKTGKKRIIGVGREVEGMHKDGSSFPIHLSVGKAQINDKTLYVGTITDLTELKNTEQALRDFHERLDLATEAGGIGVWQYDVFNEILSWDDRMFELYGTTRERSPDAYETLSNALNPEDFKRIQDEMRNVIKSRGRFVTEFRINWPNGQERYIQASGMVKLDSKGYSQHMTGVNLDITDRKLSEQAMLNAKQAAEEANRQKSAFINTMSHELRTPLTVILGYLPLLRNMANMPSPETIVQIVKDMGLCGNHLLEMINDLLDISKIEAGEMHLSIEEVNVQSLIRDILQKFNNQAQQKGIQLLSDAGDFNCQVDVRRLRQIFINLVGNALKFTSKGSIKISAIRDERFATFSITDTGIGISESNLPIIFNTFQQVDDSSTRSEGGSGLGLTITKRLVELHGGTIHVKSQLGSGTTFTFTIRQ